MVIHVSLFNGLGLRILRSYWWRRWFLVLTVIQTSWRGSGDVSEFGTYDYKTSMVPLFLHGLFHDRGLGSDDEAYQGVETSKENYSSGSPSVS